MLLIYHVDLIPDVSAHSGRQASVASQSSNYAGLDDITELIVNYNERKHNDEDVAESIADHSDYGEFMFIQPGVVYHLV